MPKWTYIYYKQTLSYAYEADTMFAWQVLRMWSNMAMREVQMALHSWLVVSFFYITSGFLLDLETGVQTAILAL